MKSKDGTDSSDPATETDHPDTEGCNFGLNPMELPYLWYPNQESVNHLEYVRRLECEFTCLQRAFLTLTTQFARLQFRVRQIVQADPCEREALLRDLEHMAFNAAEENDELPPIQRDAVNMGDVRRKQNFIIERLRQQLCTLAEAESWQPIPELDAEPPAPNSIDEVTCFCIKNKRKPPPDTPNREGNESGRISSAGSTHSSASKSKTGLTSESPSEYDRPRNGSLKQRVSYVDEQDLAMNRNTNTAYSVQTSCACVEVCEEKLTCPVAVLRKPRPACECIEACQEKMSFQVRKPKPTCVCNEACQEKMSCPARKTKPACECNKSMRRRMNNNSCEHK